MDSAPIQDAIVEVFDWIESVGVWGPVVLMVLYAAIVPLLLPGLPLTLAAGFLFGVLPGTVYVVVGETIGSIAPFLIARRHLSKRLEKRVLSHPRLRALSAAVAHEGWRFVLATRVVPFFPYKLSNYAFGLTPLSLKGFLYGTFFGLIPISLLNVYLGSLIGDVAALAAGHPPQTPLQRAIDLAGFLAVVGFVIYITRVARRNIERELKASEQAPR